MNYDTEKIDEAVLALLHLTRCDDKFGAAAWKSHDWDALNRLHEKGYIGNLITMAKSVELTEERKAQAEELFRKLFGKPKGRGTCRFMLRASVCSRRQTDLHHISFCAAVQ